MWKWKDRFQHIQKLNQQPCQHECFESSLTTRVLALIAFLAALIPLNSHSVAAEEFVRSSVTNRVLFVKGTEAAASPTVSSTPTSSTTDPRKTAASFISMNSSNLGVGATTLKIQRINKDLLGMNHVSYNQFYRRIPVFAGEVLVHTNNKGEFSSASSSLATALRVRSVAKIKRYKAVAKAVAAWKAEFKIKKRPSVKHVKQYILDMGVVSNKPENVPYLVWGVKVSDNSLFRGYDYYVDAASGEVILSIPEARHIDRKVYDCSAPVPPGDPSRCPIVTVDGYKYGRLEGDPPNGPNPRYLPGEQSTDADDLYDKLLEIHNYYLSHFGRNGASNQGGTGAGIYYPTRTYGATYGDYTPGWTCPDAATQNGAMEFCKDFIMDDVVGHEYAHIVVLYSHFDGTTPTDMVYRGESGALNESNSDVMGEMFELAKNGSCDWISGGGSKWGDSVGRVLYDPPSRSHWYWNIFPPDRFHSRLVYCSIEDNGGTHLNSTIPSKAAYLMSRGGYFNGCTISAIGEKKVEQIQYRVTTQYYSRTETFNGAYYKWIAACGDLYGADSNECLQVKRALQSVEMDQPGTCTGASPSVPACADTEGW